MAKIISNNFELEFLVTECCDFDPTEFYFKIIMRYNGIPVLNDKAMKRHNSYWKKGAKGGIIAWEVDTIRLVRKLENALSKNEVQFWESYPDPDVHVSIYPHRCFPNLVEEDKEHFSIIISPNSYQFKKSDNYYGYDGVSFVMAPSEKDLRQFTDDLKTEMLEKVRETFGKKHSQTLMEIDTDRQSGRIISKRKTKIVHEPCEVEFDENYFIQKKECRSVEWLEENNMLSAKRNS